MKSLRKSLGLKEARKTFCMLQHRLSSDASNAKIFRLYLGEEGYMNETEENNNIRTDELLAGFFKQLLNSEEQKKSGNDNYTRIDMLKVRDQNICQAGSVRYRREGCGVYSEL